MIFAVVPAAGLGSRMGRPKLSLPLVLQRYFS
jgi:CTP:molybdopterin cytidylyltransferase MocA